MFYREAGQFKASYAQDQQIFPIRQDRIAMGALLAVAFVIVPLTANQYWFAAILTPFFDTPLRTAAERHPNLVDYVARMMRVYYPAHVWPQPQAAAA